MKKGFTLSEVLITLGIIGIVAVLTIPAVMKNYKNRLYVSQLEKTYAQISDAAQAIMNDEHCSNFYETKAARPNSWTNAAKGECQAGAGYFLNNYFKPIRRNCKTGTDKCLADKYTNIDGAAAGSFYGEYCIQTTNGAAICIEYNKANHVPSVAVDINGTSEPNMTGRDVFVMNISEKGTIIDWGNADDCNKANAEAHIAKYAAGCLRKVKDAGWKMEY